MSPTAPPASPVSDMFEQPIGSLPASLTTSPVAAGSHRAYAVGKAERCTACAASVTLIEDQPEMSSSPGWPPRPPV